MFNFKTFNNIAEDGLDILRNNQFKEVSGKPDGILLRPEHIGLPTPAKAFVYKKTCPPSSVGGAVDPTQWSPSREVPCAG